MKSTAGLGRSLHFAVWADCRLSPQARTSYAETAGADIQTTLKRRNFLHRRKEELSPYATLGSTPRKQSALYDSARPDNLSCSYQRHDGETDNLGAAVKVLEWVTFCHGRTLQNRPARLNLIPSDRTHAIEPASLIAFFKAAWFSSTPI